jgi:hypothetical protein
MTRDDTRMKIIETEWEPRRTTENRKSGIEPPNPCSDIR